MNNMLDITRTRFKLYIFDLNGTLTNTPFVDKAPLSILPGRAEALAELKAKGAKLSIASNQGGVAFGFTTEQAALDEVAGVASSLNIDAYRVAFGHPSPKRGYEEYASQEHLSKRKPEPGMLISLMKEFRVSSLHTLMVGDRDEDRDAAHKAQCNFMWAKDFFANHDELLGTTYHLYRSLMGMADNADKLYTLEMWPDGSGRVGYSRNPWISWTSLDQAPQQMEQAIKDYPARLAEKKRIAESGDDFDPFECDHHCYGCNQSCLAWEDSQQTTKK